MSWESSIEYERLINQGARERLSGSHSADLVIRSYDFATIEALQAAGECDARLNCVATIRLVRLDTGSSPGAKPASSAGWNTKHLRGEAVTESDAGVQRCQQDDDRVEVERDDDERGEYPQPSEQRTAGAHASSEGRNEPEFVEPDGERDGKDEKRKRRCQVDQRIANVADLDRRCRQPDQRDDDRPAPP